MNKKNAAISFCQHVLCEEVLPERSYTSIRNKIGWYIQKMEFLWALLVLPFWSLVSETLILITLLKLSQNCHNHLSNYECIIFSQLYSFNFNSSFMLINLNDSLLIDVWVLVYLFQTQTQGKCEVFISYFKFSENINKLPNFTNYFDYSIF